MSPSRAANGGFPEPPDRRRVRVVKSAHGVCGRETRVRLPAHLPTAAVRRVVCHGCAQAYEAAAVEEVALGHRRAWRYASVPIAAAAVIGGLMLLQGEESSEPTTEPAAPAAGETAARGGRAGAEPKGGRSDTAGLVRESSFSLALPAGWRRTNPAGGATFTAAAAGGEADASLWVERDRDLTFAKFETRSLAQLESLAGSARVVERTPGPTPSETIVRLAADPPAGSPSYEVTLRAAGPYRYYLSTTVAPDASAATSEAADLVHGSLVPAGSGGKG